MIDVFTVALFFSGPGIFVILSRLAKSGILKKESMNQKLNASAVAPCINVILSNPMTHDLLFTGFPLFMIDPRNWVGMNP